MTPLDPETAALAAAVELLAVLHGWSLADVALLIRAARLGSPSRLHAGLSDLHAADRTDHRDGAGIACYTPPTREGVAAALHLYRMMGGPR